MIDSYARKLTKTWLKKQDCTVVAYWGKEPCDLWKFLDIYAHADMDGDSTEDMLWENFSDIAEDIEVKVLNPEEYHYPSVLKEILGCPNAMVFLQDEQVELNRV